uniref:long-chain-fatty-acid--CoA ligase n=1 Tax=Heterorhabditis bacteriophora TaxID=37862 RepID=A0A1I7X8E0_HETBA
MYEVVWKHLNHNSDPLSLIPILVVEITDLDFRSLLDLVDHFLLGSCTSLPSYLSLAAAGAVTMGLGYYLTKGSEGKITPLVDPCNQNIKLPDGSRISAYLKDGQMQSYLFEDSRTLYQGVRRGARVSNNGPMLGRRVKQEDGSEPYVWHHYNEILERANYESIAFRVLGIPVGNHVNIGIYAKNRPEWVITELAAYNFSNVIVPIYETLGFDACVFILNQTEMQIVVCDTSAKALGTSLFNHVLTIYDFLSIFGSFRGDITALADDIKELRPTVVPVVPRVLNRLYDKVMNEVNKSRIKKILFDLAIMYKSREMKSFIVRNNGFFDNLVFKKIREGMGGIFFVFPLSCQVDDNRFCSIGRERTHLRASCNGLYYRGGIWTDRMCCSVYGMLIYYCYCSSHLRKRSIQGEYVAPEKIENIYVRSRFVAQSFVHGESLKTCLIAIVVPDAEVSLEVTLVPACDKELGISGTFDELCVNPTVKKFVLDDMLAVGKKAGLFSFEQVKDIYLCAEMFSVENDLLTPTLKSKRPRLKTHFAVQLDNMYSWLK